LSNETNVARSLSNSLASSYQRGSAGIATAEMSVVRHTLVLYQNERHEFFTEGESELSIF